MTSPVDGRGAEISVVIPTHDRRERLRALLESQAQQTLPPERFEVVVAVDGSSDGTAEILEELTLPYRLLTLPLAWGGSARARNEGAKRASGRFLLFLDDDMIADPRLVAEHLDAQLGEDRTVGLGKVALLPPSRSTRWSRWRQQRRRMHFEGLAAKPAPSFMNCWSGNLSVPRELFLAVGGFLESYPAPGMEIDVPMHDSELGFRLSEGGARFLFVESAVSIEDDRETLRDSLHHSERFGAGELVLYALHPSLLPRLQIGGLTEHPWRLVGVRRILIALRVPPLVIAALAALVPSERRAGDLYTLLYSYNRWRAVRRAAPDRETWRRLRRGTTILIYHAIARPGERAGRYRISARRFRRQLVWLKLRGYRVIDLDELVRLRREFRLPPAKSVVITFDDGFADNLELALPLLERHGFPCTLFLASAAGTRCAWSGDGQLAGRELLGPEQAGAFLANGSVGAHTRTHVDLLSIGLEQARAEIAGSKQELEAALGVPVTLFAYPYGSYDERIRRLVREAGFEAACTITPGPNWPATDPFELRRVEVRGTDSLLRFALTVWLGDIGHLVPRRRSRSST
jgi:peptidoglycan/xylan/chitin deacetylase (PgdA/CDA1 family)/GT2 family glycosyltransferase